MDTPPPPPLHHFRSPSYSPAFARTPVSERSFDMFGSIDGGDRYSDSPLYRAHSHQPKIETRAPGFTDTTKALGRPLFGRAESVTSVMESTMGKDYLLFHFTKEDGASWYDDPIIEEIGESQAAIRKKAETGARSSSSNQRMGPNRRSQIDRLKDNLNAQEVDGSLWKLVYVGNIISVLEGSKMDVKKFEVIFARKPSRHSMSHIGNTPGLPPMFGFSTSNLGSVSSGSVRDDDPFDEKPLFDYAGAALGGHGLAGFGSSRASPYVSSHSRRHTETHTPNIIHVEPEGHGFGAIDPVGHHDAPIGLGIPTVADDVLSSIKPFSSKDIHGGKEQRKSKGLFGETLKKAFSETQKRPAMRTRASEPASRTVRFSGRHDSPIEVAVGSGSSAASDDVNGMFEDVEEMSSYTSGSSSSNGRKANRPNVSAHRQHRSTNYELSGSGPSGSRKRHSSTLSPLRSQTSLSKSSQGDVPPEAVYPHFFERDELKLRDQLAGLGLDKEPGQRRSVYDYEPRDKYTRRGA